MKQRFFLHRKTLRCLLLLSIFLLPFISSAQQNVIVDMASIDGISITPDNIFNFRLQSIGNNNANSVLIKGVVRYRNSPQNFSYSFTYNIHSGLNEININTAHPQWQFSSSALQDLFFNYKTLPSGTYEYCVTVYPISVKGEVSANGTDECLYHKSDDAFLINLIFPDDKAKIREYYPMLSWVANSSLSNELTYRLRIAEIKHGQNTINAVMRNQPVFSESNIMQNSLVYPAYGKPLIKDQPYAWAVDAYYKGILLGGSEAWQFTIIDDSLFTGAKGNRSYIDIKRENGKAKQYAVGEIKLKYVLENARLDILTLVLNDGSGNKITVKPGQLNAQYGDNRYVVNLIDGVSLKHNGEYTLILTTQAGSEYKIPFVYLNPDFIK